MQLRKHIVVEIGVEVRVLVERDCSLPGHPELFCALTLKDPC
jgi:hypothetical protein